MLIILTPRGSKAWYWIRKVRTSSSGYFAGTFTDPVTASWSAEYEGNATHFACVGSVHHVRVKGASVAFRSMSGVLSPLVAQLSAMLQDVRAANEAQAARIPGA